ncbi:ubiquinol-cytochrome-c reductase complex assembly factor 1-like [Chenopodium quinoa]|uniref:Ubiquinol-cytochrome c chaperone domain-containing protein n=1 Tax=Chenopodium quinoa TaxID=63459 RepID=A0A803KT83_CHEQI|nr:ubiquinol-cytochrome-c reductase complex assembly factor 1-like [Chenopodium quinoa]
MLARWSRAISQISNAGSQSRILGGFSNTQNYAKVAAFSMPPSSSSLDSNDFNNTNIPTVKLDKLFWSKPCSLALAKDSPLRIEEPDYQGIRRFFLKLMLFYSKQSKSIRGANVVYRRIITQADKSAIYNVFNIEKTFKTTFSLLVLHMWMCLRRLKEEGQEGVEFGQYVYEIYNHDLELRVSKAGVNLLLTKWMKDLEKIFYGNLVAYDAALLPEAGKDDLSNVIWRNVFSDDGKSEPSDAARRPVQAMARYVRREISCLSLTDKEAMFSGNFKFSSLENPLLNSKKS